MRFRVKQHSPPIRSQQPDDILYFRAVSGHGSGPDGTFRSTACIGIYVHDKEPKGLKIRARAATKQHHGDTETQLVVWYGKDIGHPICFYVAICWRVQSLGDGRKRLNSKVFWNFYNAWEKTRRGNSASQLFQMSETYIW